MQFNTLFWLLVVKWDKFSRVRTLTVRIQSSHLNSLFLGEMYIDFFSNFNLNKWIICSTATFIVSSSRVIRSSLGRVFLWVNKFGFLNEMCWLEFVLHDFGTCPLHRLLNDLLLLHLLIHVWIFLWRSRSKQRLNIHGSWVRNFSRIWNGKNIESVGNRISYPTDNFAKHYSWMVSSFAFASD